LAFDEYNCARQEYFVCCLKETGCETAWCCGNTGIDELRKPSVRPQRQTTDVTRDTYGELGEWLALWPVDLTVACWC
jgi:hypothetical protein